MWHSHSIRMCFILQLLTDSHSINICRTAAHEMASKRILWVDFLCYFITLVLKLIPWKRYQKKVKQSLHRPWGCQEVKPPIFSWQSAHEGGTFASLRHRPPLSPQEIFLVHISVRVWVDPRAILRPEGLSQWKIPMTPQEIEQAISRIVA